MYAYKPYQTRTRKEDNSWEELAVLRRREQHALGDQTDILELEADMKSPFSKSNNKIDTKVPDDPIFLNNERKKLLDELYKMGINIMLPGISKATNQQLKDLQTLLQKFQEQQSPNFGGAFDLNNLTETKLLIYYANQKKLHETNYLQIWLTPRGNSIHISLHFIKGGGGTIYRDSLVYNGKTGTFENEESIDNSFTLETNKPLQEENNNLSSISENVIVQGVTSNSEQTRNSEIFSWNYYDETLSTRGEEIDKNWIPIYSGYNDPDYGKDISLFSNLTPAQRLKYNWDEIKAQWKEVNNDKSISNSTLEQWIRKNIINGWQEGDPIPDIKEIKVKYDEATGRPVIQAHTFEEAWQTAGELGLRKNRGDIFYWETKILNTKKGYQYNFAPPDVYYNRTKLMLEDKSTYVNDMSVILGDEQLKKNVLAEKGFEDEFARMVRETQYFLGLKVDGKMTPQTALFFHREATKISYRKKEEEEKEARRLETYEEGYFIDTKRKNQFGKNIIEYHYHNKHQKNIYVQQSNIDEVTELANSYSDLDSEVDKLTNDEIFRLEFNTRIKAIKSIADGWVVTYGNEKSILRLFEHIPPHEYQKMRDWIKQNRNTLINKIKYEVEHDDLRQELNELLAERYNFTDTADFKELKEAVQEDTFSADSKAFVLPNSTLKQLEYENNEYDRITGEKILHKSLLTDKGYYKQSFRLRIIETIANGYVVGDEDESTIVKYLTVLPDNEKVARAIRREIAKELINSYAYIQGPFETIKVEFALLRKLHDVTHGGEYYQLTNALDQIFEENGDLYAQTIRKTLNSISKGSVTDIEILGKYGSKEAYKFLTNSEKGKFIKLILDGNWVDDTDEQTIIDILESVGKPKKNINTNDPKAISQTLLEEKKQKQEFYNQLSSGSYGFTLYDLRNRINGEEHTTLRRLVNSMNETGSKYRIEQAEGVNNNLSNAKRREYISYFSEHDFYSLDVEQRKEFIKLLVELEGSSSDQFFLWTDDKMESAIVKIIESTPKDQAEELSTWIYKKSITYTTLKSAIDGAEYKQFHRALNTLNETVKAEKALPSVKLDELRQLKMDVQLNPDDLDKFIEYQKIANQIHTQKSITEELQQQELIDLQIQQMESSKVFPYGSDFVKDDQGNKISKITFSYDIKMIDTPTGARVQIVATKNTLDIKSGNTKREKSEPLLLEPNEPIGVYFLTELNDNKQYSLATMPAVNFDMVLNESFKKDMWELVEVATLIIGLIPVLKVGVSALVKTISAIDVAIMAAAIIVDRNKDSLPGWFRESFGYIETASIGLILVGNPRHLLKAEQQLAKLDGHIANLSKAQRAIPGLENALSALKETLEGQINFGKRVAKSDESTLRKLITEVSESTMDGAKKRELLEALNEQLRTVTKKAVSVLDEAAYRQKQISDALINQGQEAVSITKKTDMTAPVITKTEKTGEAILDGNSIILKSADGADIARPLFRSTDEALAWLEYSKKSRFSDARHIDELEPKMHPWFFDSNGKKLLAESHPHLYDGTRPLSLGELFGTGGKLVADNSALIKHTNEFPVLTQRIRQGLPEEISSKLHSWPKEKLAILEEKLSKPHYAGLFDDMSSPSLFSILDEILEHPEQLYSIIKGSDELTAVIERFARSRFFTEFMEKGREFEQAITKLADEADHELLSEIAQKAGTSADELATYTHLSQVQVYLPDGKYFIADNLWFKTKEILNDSGEVEKITEVIINETKLSKATDLSSNQKEFVNLVTEGIQTNFVTRSDKFKRVLPQGSKIEVKGITKTIKDEAVKNGYKVENIYP